MTSPAEYFRLCSSCKRPLPFAAPYYRCSVSTCNRAKMPYTFCSVACWQAHVPVLRHRDAWAEEQRAPTQDAWQAAQAAEASAARTRTQDEGRQAAARNTERRAATANNPIAASKEPNMSNEVAKEVVIVVSKVKAYIKARSGMNTSDAVAEALSDVVRNACDTAIERAKTDGRKTVMLRDVTGGTEP